MPATEQLSASRLNRLLLLLEKDARNGVLRKDAIREACQAAEWDIARTLIDIGLEWDSKDKNLFLLSGRVFLQAQRYDEAERALVSARELGLDTADVQYSLAFTFFMQKRFVDALDLLVSPLLQFEMPLAHVLRARCLHHLSRPAQAIAECEAALAHIPDDAGTNGLLALLLYETGKIEPARRRAEAALRKDSRQMEALLVSAYLHSDSGEYEDARQNYDTLLKFYPKCGRAWLGSALLRLNYQQLKAARHDVKFAAALMPEHIGTWHTLAWTEILLGDVVAGESAFVRALEIDRNFGETHGGLAAVAALQGRESEARTSIRRALRLSQNSMSASYAEMVLLQRAGHIEEAQAIVDRFLDRTSPIDGVQFRDLVMLQMKRLQVSARVSSHTTH